MKKLVITNTQILLFPLMEKRYSTFNEGSNSDSNSAKNH
jgi:hypothetical protein